MPTLKQVEALTWIVRTGSFERAAARLNTTQSTISKRIHDLEEAVGAPVFDRNNRSARLTECGEHILALGEEMLAVHQKMLAFRTGAPPARRLRIGVTELSAFTWLARFVTAMQQEFPTVSVEPVVEHSRTLFEHLLYGNFDLIVVPNTFVEPKIEAIPVAEVANAWFSRSGLVTHKRALDVADLASFTLLVQGSRSGTGLFYSSWFKSQGALFNHTITTDSLVALVGLTMAGVGISYLPQDCFMDMVKEGKMGVVKTRPKLPPVPYAILRQKEPLGRSMEAFIDLVKAYCDFGHQFQT